MPLHAASAELALHSNAPDVRRGLFSAMEILSSLFATLLVMQQRLRNDHHGSSQTQRTEIFPFGMSFVQAAQAARRAP